MGKRTAGESRHQIIGEGRSLSADHRNVIGNIITFFLQDLISNISQLDGLAENGGYFFLKHGLNALFDLSMGAGLGQDMMSGTVRGKGRKCILVSGDAGVGAVTVAGIYNTADAFAMVKRLQSPGLAVNLDLSTMISNGERLRDFVDDIKYVSHVHISEPGLEPIVPRQEHKELALLLKAVGYSGDVSIEMKRTDVETVRKTLAYIAEVFA